MRLIRLHTSEGDRELHIRADQRHRDGREYEPIAEAQMNHRPVVLPCHLSSGERHVAGELEL